MSFSKLNFLQQFYADLLLKKHLLNNNVENSCSGKHFSENHETFATGFFDE